MLPGPRTPPPPIVVDLDGTLIATDTLLETGIKAIKASPLDILRLPLWLLKGRAHLKKTLAKRGAIDIGHLPYRNAVISYLRAEKAKGRPIILATAADAAIARGVSDHLGIFDDVLASDGKRNLKAQEKLNAIREKVGPDFVYAGDSAVDIPIWQAAQRAIFVGVSPRVAEAVRQDVFVEKEFPTEPVSLGVWLKAMRIHQWIKNLLLFVPLLTSFGFADVEKILLVTSAFLVFSFAASATYMANDIWDLESDRSHPRKRLRPFACGKIPLAQGLPVAGLSLIAALAVSWTLSPGFFALLCVYVSLTSAYSIAFKEHVLVDVLMLAGLYTFRIIAGSVVSGVVVSSWLLAFSFFIFLSLALVKRCSELLVLRQAGKQSTRGRDYRVSDLAILKPFGTASALASVVVFGLFISAPETQARYATPNFLWLVAVAMVYWLGRLWIKTSRGEMHDDPIIFAIKDKGSRTTVFIMVLITIAAEYISFRGG